MINENIKSARKAKGMSQEEMAVKLNVVRQTVSKWEKGLSVPDADVLIRIADLLEVPVNDLLGVKLQSNGAEDLAKELARLNEQLALKNQEESLGLQAAKKRGLILLLSFMAMLLALGFKNERISLLLMGSCILAALIILYRNLALLTRSTAADAKIGALKITTLFNMVIWVLTVAVIGLSQTAGLKLSESNGELLALAIISAVMLFGGFVSPKLPYNRHTGLRLPWTVQDEDTWNVAHKTIGYISLPIVLLYLTASFTMDHFEAASTAAVLLWIGIPGLISLVFWWRKSRGKL